MESDRKEVSLCQTWYYCVQMLVYITKNIHICLKKYTFLKTPRPYLSIFVYTPCTHKFYIDISSTVTEHFHSACSHAYGLADLRGTRQEARTALLTLMMRYVLRNVGPILPDYTASLLFVDTAVRTTNPRFIMFYCTLLFHITYYSYVTRRLTCKLASKF
jgi:hypothetical protein